MGGGLALILFLVFGGIFLSKIHGDKQSHKLAKSEYERQKADDDARFAHWLSSVTDMETEIDFEDRLYNEDEDLIKEVRDSWNYYFGMEAPPRFNRDVDKFQRDNECVYVSDYAIDRMIALKILMANRGKLTKYDAEFGVKFYSSHETRKREQETHAILVRFFNAVNSRLKEHGIDEEMYASADLGSTFKPIEVIYGGKVCWRPMIRTSTWELSELRRQGKV